MWRSMLSSGIVEESPVLLAIFQHMNYKTCLSHFFPSWYNLCNKLLEIKKEAVSEPVKFKDFVFNSGHRCITWWDCGRNVL